MVSLVVSAMTEGEEYSAGFEEQAHLWLEDPAEFLQRFLTLGSAPGPEELELQPEETPSHGTPSLQLFQQEVWDGCSGCTGYPGGLGARGGAGCPGGCWPWAVTSSRPQIDMCEALCEEVSEFANTEVFGGWLQSDCRPFKQALLGAIGQRGLVLRQHLARHVTTR